MVYLDGVSFVHKYNAFNAPMTPKSRVWRQKCEGLKITTKGSKELAGGQRVHMIIAIGYGKGVVLRVPYTKMDGPFFAQFITDHFRIAFARAGPKRRSRRIFIMIIALVRQVKLQRGLLMIQKQKCMSYLQVHLISIPLRIYFI